MFGGVVVNSKSFPFIVSILLLEDGFIENAHECMGSILSNRYIVSAAHCYKKYCANKTDGKLIVVHGRNRLNSYCPNTHIYSVNCGNIKYYKEYDLALLKTNEKMPDNLSIKVLEYSKFNKISQKLSNCSVVGWGVHNDSNHQLIHFSKKYYSNNLHSVPYQLTSNELRKYISKKFHLTYGIFFAYSFNIGKFGGVCSGDSGGPLFCWVDNERYLIGSVFRWGGCQNKLISEFVNLSYFQHLLFKYIS
ncbi:hypothetical protein SNEBB_007407 [Seison nebaliae]|nr:hypothetical protein SNEBB_007407 [Seison nebaliae]